MDLRVSLKIGLIIPVRFSSFTGYSQLNSIYSKGKKKDIKK